MQIPLNNIEGGLKPAFEVAYLKDVQKQKLNTRKKKIYPFKIID